jgi:dTDP-4-amino-4,6-dideoxygalactose transaminase
MEVALRVAGIGPGDEVITTPISWVSTANVILTVGAKPVFVDIDLSTRNLNLELVKAAITPATKAIMPVYLSGLPVNIDQLYEIADHYQLRVIEDAAQALGSHWQGNLIGSSHQHRSDLVSFSFQANKNMTSIEGGCLVMNHADEANLAQRLRLQGVTRTGLDGMEVDVLGGKHNMTDVNAVIGIHQLAQLSEFMVKRKALVKHYFQLFEQSKLIEYGVIPPLADMHQSNWHMFQVLLPIEQLKTRNQNRSTVMQALKDQGIGTGAHYPIITDFKLYKNLGYQSTNTPVAQQVGQAILTLPLFPLMTNQDVDRVVHSFENVFAQFH